MRRNVAILAALLEVALTALPAEAVPQTPDQIKFNKGVAAGSILVVETGMSVGCVHRPTEEWCKGIPSPFCPTINALQVLWGVSMDNNPCTALMTGSRVRVVNKTDRYAIDDPTQPIEPAPGGNEAHLIVRVTVLIVAKGSSGPPTSPNMFDLASIIGKTGYMNIDSLNWPKR